MKLTRAERKRIAAGNYRALHRDHDPECLGETIVLSWSRPTSHSSGFHEKLASGVEVETGEGEVIEAPRRPLLAIQITQVTRRAKGGWRVRFDVIDNRQPKRLVRASPPVYDPAMDDEDPLRELDAEEQEKARLEGAYTSNPKSAIDHLEAVDDAGLKEITIKARERFAEHREELDSEEERRRRERAIRDSLRDTMRGLDVPARQALLASIEREILKAKMERVA